jgi:WD40 repeat protein
LAFSPDGRTLAVGGLAIELWDVRSSRVLHRELPRRSLAGPTHLVFSPNGAVLAASVGDVVELLDVIARKPLGTPLQASGEAGLAFSPDGRTVAAAALFGGEISLWDVPSGQSIGKPLIGRGGAFTLAFSLDGRALVSGIVDGMGNQSLIAWDLNLSSWIREACSMANRNLTITEWSQFVGSAAAYRKTCPDLPLP